MKPSIVRTMVLLVFVNMALFLHFLQGPYIVLIGIFFLESTVATAIVLFMLALLLIIGYQVFRQSRKVFWLIKTIALLLLLNSLANLIATPFISDDVTGTLTRIFNENVIWGFIMLQLLFAFVNLWLYIAVKNSRKIFKH